MSAEQGKETGNTWQQPLGKVTHQSAEWSADIREDQPQSPFRNLDPKITQLSICRDSPSRNSHVSLQAAIQSARDDNSLAEARFLSRFLSPSAFVAEEVLRRRNDRAVEETAPRSEARRQVRCREAEWGFVLGLGRYGVGDEAAPSASSPTMGVRAPLRWRRVAAAAAAASLREPNRPQPVTSIWPTWPKETPGESAAADDAPGFGKGWSNAKIQENNQELNMSTAIYPETAVPKVPSADATSPAPEHGSRTPASPSRPPSVAQPQLRGRPSQASLGTTGSFSSYASTVSLTHVDAHSNLLDRDAMGGFFAVQEQQQHSNNNNDGDDGDDEEPFGTRAGIFRPLWHGVAVGRDHRSITTRQHSRDCKQGCRDVRGEDRSASLNDEDEDYVIVEKPRDR